MCSISSLDFNVSISVDLHLELGQPHISDLFASPLQVFSRYTRLDLQIPITQSKFRSESEDVKRITYPLPDCDGFLMPKAAKKATNGPVLSILNSS